jgi:hypothetical protein
VPETNTSAATLTIFGKMPFALYLELLEENTAEEQDLLLTI